MGSSRCVATALVELEFWLVWGFQEVTQGGLLSK
jgi:hypothetical protein